MSDIRAYPCFDVIVVGTGPAGATTAWELSRRGFSVLALDKHVHPRNKICGGGLSARIAHILPGDFQSVVESTIARVQFTYGGEDSFFLEFSQPVAYMVMRANFDKWLVDKARQAGTDIHENERVVKVQCRVDGVEVTTDLDRYQGRFVVGADGAMSVVAQQMFPGRRFPTIPALESEYRWPSNHSPGQAIPTAVISLSAAEKGYGWIFPKRNGLSLGVGEFVKGTNRPKRSFDAFVRGEANLSKLSIPEPLGFPLPIAVSHHKGRGHCWGNSLVWERALLVGDAGHLVDPLLGEGIYYAVRSGQLAAENMAAMIRNPEYRLQNYEDQIRQEFGPEFAVAAKLNRLIYGVPRYLHRLAGRTFPHSYQRVLRRYCAVLQGQETYQGLWGRILRRLKSPFVYRATET